MICQLCKTQEVLSNLSICYQCWSIDASQRGYTGPLDADQRWWKTNQGPFPHTTKTRMQLIVDVILVILLFYAISSQQSRIWNLADQIYVLELRMTELEIDRGN